LMQITAVVAGLWIAACIVINAWAAASWRARRRNMTYEQRSSEDEADKINVWP